MSILAAAATATFAQPGHEPGAFRPPAIPLITHDPYLSVWSVSDALPGNWPRHWTGAVQGMAGLIRVDGKTYRFCGTPSRDWPAAEQLSVDVLPTRTIYRFRAGPADLTVTFLSPLLPDDADLLSRPISTVTVEVASNQPDPHEASIYLDVTGEWAVHTADQPVRWSRARAPDLHILSLWCEDQPVLKRAGDDVRIDWGTLYFAAEDSPRTSSVIAGHDTARRAFAASGGLPAADDLRAPRPANDDWPVLAAAADLGNIAKTQRFTFYVGYDDRYSIEYHKRAVRPYWRRAGAEFSDILTAAVTHRAEIDERARAFDEKLMADLTRAGGEKYARLAALAYRQTMAAHKIVADIDGTMLMFSKENFCNGCIGTVDVFFPSAPFFLYFNPELLEAQVRPIMDYAASPRWKFPFAPHDLGTYPHANGQVYGGGEKTEENQMPIEECGNMLILLDAIAMKRGNADFAAEWWPTVTKWANYLEQFGLDPANQLCTDDFAGHLAHNANLSIKAIIGLGAYADLCKRLGKSEDAAKFRATAERFAKEWVKLADDGDHFRLAFDKPGTWSQKYNLLWDRLLGLNLFPAEIARKELAYYKTRLNKYGLPLDSRETYAKLDFAAWVAAMAESRADFEAFMNPLYDFANDSKDRVPLTDWYSTTDARCIGFRARSVVGGIYAPMLVGPASK
ncbi:MAG: DUF4965 domain-containing protein [Phycisphaerales bacterium]|nr:DUF4965 domain-containing protein [Phycisphaerales bacterium]